MSEPVAVTVRGGDCPCPGQPHTSETVYLEPHLTATMGVAAMATIRQSRAHRADMLGALSGVFLRTGIRRWTFTDAEGQPIPITPDAIEELLPWSHGGMELVTEADNLYSEDLFLPLAVTTRASSPPIATANSTPAIPPSGPEPPTSPSRSSRNGTAGKVSAAPGR